MTVFLIRRTLYGIVVLWAISVATFALFFVAPHDPARIIAGRLATPQTVALVRHRLGLDEPVLTQYWHFVDRLLHGNLGYSFYSSTQVNSLLLTRLPVTVSLALGAAVIWLSGGVLVGVLSAARPGSFVDRAATVVVLTGLSTPTFLLGILLIYFFFYRLHLVGIDFFPAGGYVPLTQSPAGWAQHLILPWITLAFVSAAVYSRLTRSSLLDTMSQDYIRTARAKGLSERRVIFRHGLRASLTPIVTIFGLDIALLVGGAIITESVFNIQGLGWLAITSAESQDLPSVLGVVLCTATAVAIMNLVVDIVYAFLDPRVRYA